MRGGGRGTRQTGVALEGKGENPATDRKDSVQDSAQESLITRLTHPREDEGPCLRRGAEVETEMFSEDRSML